MADEHWTGDVNEVVVEEWVAETTPFERVKTVLRSTTTLEYAGTIAEHARVSEPSARKHLQTLAETGFATTDSTSQGTRFKRSRETLALERIRDIHAECSREELVSGIRGLKSQIQTFQERYDVTDPDALALELAADDDEWGAIARWRATEEDLDVAQAALSLYDFDPDAEEQGDGTTSGAFARDSSDLSA